MAETKKILNKNIVDQKILVKVKKISKNFQLKKFPSRKKNPFKNNFGSKYFSQNISVKKIWHKKLLVNLVKKKLLVKNIDQKKFVKKIFS